MRLTVLTDNNTFIDQYYVGEPAVSYYLEDAGKSYLFDLGYSDVYLRNAAKMGLDLSKVEAVVLSHGHNDHTGGLADFPTLERPCRIIGHPQVFEAKRFGGLAIGSPVTQEQAAAHFTLALSKQPVALTGSLLYLGEIARTTAFENKEPVGQRYAEGVWQPDYVLDDSALVYKHPEGLCIITGCSHAGICNICEYAKKVTGESRLKAVIGGFHIFDAESEQMRQTLAYFRQYPHLALYPCHCTSFFAKAALHQVLPIQEVGVGLTLNW